MNHSVMFSSQTCEWPTPDWLFDELNEEFGFTLDACADPENAKCENFIDSREMWSALTKPWEKVVWCNPPYGRNLIAWVIKGRIAAVQGATVVFLLPARTDTAWFHDYVLQEAFSESKRVPIEIRFIRGRLKFGGAKHNAPFPSMIVVFRGTDAQIGA